MSLSHLSHLSSAPSKSTLCGLLNRTQIYLPTIHPSPYPPSSLSTIMTSIGLNANAQESLYLAMRKFVEIVIKQHKNAGETGDYVKLILEKDAKDLDPKLKELLIQVVPTLCGTWRAASLMNSPSPPKLTTIDWRVSLPRSQTDSSVSTGSTLMLNLGVDNSDGEGRKLRLEMDKAGVDTLLDGLGKIKEQLNKAL
ncbi:hypothetical protein TrLO_g13573 [Triparma laevis f. longispina]|uniref:COMM domain-containing protein n=1 Tax=Triparma laevis f. longispina TaxID=1714387 RepID=A0A9W7B103_9STRA|nr:hypothetical protein TrLO_g13573 [Triparma laevis f. longispina]